MKLLKIAGALYLLCLALEKMMQALHGIYGLQDKINSRKDRELAGGCGFYAPSPFEFEDDDED